MQLSDNFINTRYNRFSNNSIYTKTIVNKFNFEIGLKSINYKDECFINKASDEKEKVYDDILNMYCTYKEKDYSFLDDFIGDELLENYRTDRLLKIINKVQNKKYKNKDLNNILKLNNKNNPELHFFIKMSRDNATLVLIDLYHLAIYGRRYENGKIYTTSIDKKYRHYSNNTCKLDDIVILND